MHPAHPPRAVLILTLLLAGCRTEQAPAPSAAPQAAAMQEPEPIPPPAAAALASPAAVDLRPTLIGLGLTPRPQGARGTCSIFTTCEAIEFAHARRTGHAERLSPEFVNWAASQAGGRPSDGNFFHNAIAGFEKFGVCTEAEMPYQPKFDRKRSPGEAALAAAGRLREDSKGMLVIHWIVPWQAGHSGVNEEQFAEIKRVLSGGYPVAAGSGHSRLLVGYRDDAALPGGGAFLTEDSALNRFDEVTYEFVKLQVADVFWVETAGPRPAGR